MEPRNSTEFRAFVQIVLVRAVRGNVVISCVRTIPDSGQRSTIIKKQRVKIWFCLVVSGGLVYGVWLYYHNSKTKTGWLSFSCTFGGSRWAFPMVWRMIETRDCRRPAGSEARGEGRERVI